MRELYLSRATLKREVPSAALRTLLVPSEHSARLSAAHRLVWTLFADAPDRQRDFLWRERQPGTFYLLSYRRPVDRHELFDVDPPKVFAPVLRVGQRLEFMLRANATVARAPGAGMRGKPCDVVMDAILKVPSAERPAARQLAVETAGLAWLARQGERHGFSIGNDSGVSSLSSLGSSALSARVASYQTVRLDHRGPHARLGILDFEGTLQVTEPDRLVAAIAAGIGRAKAFGCGLMLIRMAREHLYG